MMARTGKTGDLKAIRLREMFRAGAVALTLGGLLAGSAVVLAPAAAVADEPQPAKKPMAKPAQKAAAPAENGLHDPLGGFATDPNEPIDIEADALEVQDKLQTATFTGNVVATQGQTKLRADRLRANYGAAPGAKPVAGGHPQIREIYATGNVHVLSKDDQSADGDWAQYTVAERKIVMGDKVVLRQGKNVIRGTKLFIDLNSGRSRIVGSAEAGSAKTGATGRVKALFQPPPKEKK
ncbi:MAG: lipopolysaccharide transport periplasmic protein LptA [Parvibaculum sp.]|uniref:lipopolysaccharide transport periplasmic protein LptA n=1 Tax=Parvibaculum sp. TaxID=2024848 RepID=UPI002846B6FF|nr:lipopolysaccharide transport periplasmic protein LptA [Parvibaculum sp.]MDR3499802.1 lipopolysaccharide transport periplasmic protein LptA [Parvibaculum sp.]